MADPKPPTPEQAQRLADEGRELAVLDRLGAERGCSECASEVGLGDHYSGPNLCQVHAHAAALEDAARYADSHPLAPDTHTGRRQKWLRSSIAEGLRRLARGEKVDQQAPPEPSCQRYCLCAVAGARWLDGPFDSLEAARAEIPRWEDGYSGPVTVHEVVTLRARDWIPDIDDILESANERAIDNGWGTDDGPAFDMANKDARQAQEELRAWADKWIGASQILFAGDQAGGEGGGG